MEDEILGDETMSGRPGFGRGLVPFVSVIIPVFNEGARLRVCLDALAEQTYPKDRYEIIVVDNGSEELPVWINDVYPGVVLAEEPRPGSYAARNRGITAARGEIFAFTDGDCIPDPQWVANGANEFSVEQGIGLVGGRIEFCFRDPDYPSTAELYSSIMHLNQRAAVQRTGFAVTANMFTARSVMERVGVFDPSVKSGGDREWGQRVKSAGYRLVYSEDAVVRHPARDTFEQIRNRNVRVIGGHHELHARAGQARRWRQIARELILDLSPPIPFVMRLIRDRRIKGVRRKALVTLIHIRAKLVNAKTRVLLGLGMRPTRS